MARKLKLLGLGAVIAIAVTVATSASTLATTGGHFTLSKEHTILYGSDEEVEGKTTMTMKLGTLQYLTCKEASSYVATTNNTTVTEILVVPEYKNCELLSWIPFKSEKAEVTMWGCSMSLTVGNEAAEDNTVHLVCPPGKKPLVHTKNCELSFPPQTPWGGISYSTIVEYNKHALTANVTLEKFTYENHKGTCTILPTDGTASLTGTATASAFNTEGSAEDITAIGSLDPIPKFNSEVEHTVTTGSQTTTSTYDFGVLIGKVECKKATFAGTVTAKTARELTLTPTYEECEGIERQITVDTNGCAYVLKITGEEGKDGPVTIECPAGKSITTTVDSFPGGCTLTIPPQTLGGVVDYKEEGAGSSRDLLLTWTLEGIDFKLDGCELGGEGTNGTYAGSVTLKGQNTSSEQVGLWIE